MFNPPQLFLNTRTRLQKSFTKRTKLFLRPACVKKVVAGKAGFTLLELIVSISIIAFITAIVVFNQGDLSDQISLGNVANNIELQIRQAQIYGISVKESTVGSNQFGYAYGVAFNLNVSGGATGPTSYISFSDVNANGAFNQGANWTTCAGVSECVRIDNIARGNYILKFCVIDSNSIVQCTPTPTIGRVDITFLRPNPAAKINLRNTSGADVNTSFSNFSGARIVLQSPKGSQKTISVYATGQISVQ
jgi:prepilin-type N-terminal cleavage/methylation domain-containing protein